MVTAEFKLRGFPPEKRSQLKTDFTYRYQTRKAKAERTAEKLLHIVGHLGNLFLKDLSYITT